MTRALGVAVLWTALLLALPGSASAEAAPPRAYRLFTVIDLERGRLSGTMRLAYRHEGACPAGTLVFLLAPNRLATPPDVPVERLDALYPKGFAPASLAVDEVHGPGGVRLPSVAEGSRLTVALPAPLAPGEATLVSLAFETSLPVAQGLVGRLEGVLRVQGGFHPLLAAFDDAACAWRTDRVPPPAAFDATFAAPPEVSVVSAGSHLPATGPGPADTTRVSAVGRWLPLVASDRYRPLAREVGPVRLEAMRLSRGRGQVAHILDVAAASVRVFEARHGRLPREAVLRFAEVPHAFGVAAAAEGVIFFDPRLAKVLAWLKPFHDRQLAFRVFEALWRLTLAEEGVVPAPWVLEALAAIEVEVSEGALGDPPPRFERFISRFGFIPLVDEFLYSDRVPDRAVFQQGFTLVEDPMDLNRLDAPRLGGAHIVRKLRALVGRGDLSAAAVTYGADPAGTDFVAVLSAQAGRDLAPFVQQWTTAPRAADYGVEVARGPRETTVRVTARPPASPPPGFEAAVPAEEPVPVVVSFRGGGEERVVLEAPEVAAFRLRSERPVRSVEVDPDVVTEDRWREDNRVPPRWRVLLNEFSITVDIREAEVSFALGGTAQRRREGGPVYGLRGFRDQQSAGVTASVGFDLPRWSSEVRHGFNASLSGERLDRGFGEAEADARWITEVGASYSLDSRHDVRNPLTGMTAGVSIRMSETALASDADYVIAEARATRYVRVGPGQALAFRAEVGETLDGRPPFGKGLLLGGFDRLRAYAEDAFSGRSLSLGSVEYRFPLIRDLDQWVAGLIGFGGLSAVVGVEAGQVSDDRNPFRWDEYRTGVNVGLRFAVRIFGVSPVLWSLDAAMPLDGGPEPGDTRYYISASQSF